MFFSLSKFKREPAKSIIVRFPYRRDPRDKLTATNPGRVIQSPPKAKARECDISRFLITLIARNCGRRCCYINERKIAIWKRNVSYIRDVKKEMENIGSRGFRYS